MAHKITTFDALNDSTQSYKVSIEGWCDGRRRARLSFSRFVNQEPVFIAEIEPKSIHNNTALDVLRGAKDLAMDICCGNGPVSICAVQDTLFAFVDRIPEDHCLRSLEVIITVVLPNDNNERSMIVSDVWQRTLLKQDIIQENKKLQPGELSRMHMAAFLTDPLRKIRRLPRRGSVNLALPGRTGAAWKEVFDGVEKLICGNIKAKDYEVFRRYFEDIRNLIRGIDIAVKNTDRLQGKPAPLRFVSPSPRSPEALSLTPAPARSREIIDLTVEPYDAIDLTVDDTSPSLGLPGLRVLTKALAIARIRGSFIDLRVAHDRLLRMADNVLEAAAPLPEDMQLLGVLERLQQNLNYATDIFPDEVDVSYYAYNESDARLAIHRSNRKASVPQGSQNKRKRKLTEKTHERSPARQHIDLRDMEEY